MLYHHVTPIQIYKVKQLLSLHLVEQADCFAHSRNNIVKAA